MLRPVRICFRSDLRSAFIAQQAVSMTAMPKQCVGRSGKRAKVGNPTRKRTRRRQLCCEECEALTFEVEAGRRPKQTPVSSVSCGVLLLHPAHPVSLQLNTSDQILAMGMSIVLATCADCDRGL